MRLSKLLILGTMICLFAGCSSFIMNNTATAQSEGSSVVDNSAQNDSSNTDVSSGDTLPMTDAVSEGDNKKAIRSVYDYGVVGDGITDDSKAIQKAIDSEMPVYFPRGTYSISQPILITGKLYWSMYAQDATFLYSGNGYAFRIMSAENCHIEIGQINAMDGGGIEFFSDSNTNWNQYVSLSFNSIECKTDCIHVKVTNGGWSAENQIYGGRFKAGENGVNVEHPGMDFTNGWKFYNCGIEGVTNGFCFNAGWGYIDDMVIVNPRYEESYKTILKTKGKVFNCLWIGTSVFRSEEIECSRQTDRFEIIAPIGDEGHRGCIIDGKLMVEKINYEEVQ